ncbi:MAG: ANTAR domain-containing protein [Acidimicrobiales bacterium]
MDSIQSASGPTKTMGPGLEEVTAAFRRDLDRGQVDRLAAFLESAITIGYAKVMVDLCDNQAIDAAAVDVIVGAATRMAGSGARLTVRSSTKVAWRIAEVCPSPTLLRLELSDGEDLPLDRARPSASSEDRRMAPSMDLVHDLVGSQANAVDESVVNRCLRLVVSLAHSTIGSADGVSISLRRQGRLTTVAASNQTVTDMDAVQYATGEGPCVDAATVGRRFHAEALDHESRWPEFTPRARELGINAILSTPLLSVNLPVGAINIYSRSPAAFGMRDQELALILADETSRILTGAASDVTEGLRAVQLASVRLRRALRTRQVIAQAQGVMMERETITEDGAYDLIRDFSRGTNRPLRERAEDIVASTGRIRPDGEPPQTGGHRG